jgi:pRiA4b ORF-3-like protein
VARTWLSIRVELVEGGGKTFWPRPGRTFAAGGPHTFAALAHAIDTAFARWDLAHLREFRLADGKRIGPLDEDEDKEQAEVLDEATTKLSRLAPSDRFLYVFDFGDRWNHLCTVEAEKVDPLDALGGKPSAPLPYFGWGDLPDQHGRRFADDDGGDGPVPHNPHRTDLPPFFPWWGERTATHPD